MDQERVTLVPPGGIERTARSIEYLGSTKGMENMFPKLERYITRMERYTAKRNNTRKN